MARLQSELESTLGVRVDVVLDAELEPVVRQRVDEDVIDL